VYIVEVAAAAVAASMLLFCSYVLIHHVMGSIDGQSGVWAYVEGGMGSVSQAIANCARYHGASIFTSKVLP